jgi:hypothetical protein
LVAAAVLRGAVFVAAVLAAAVAGAAAAPAALRVVVPLAGAVRVAAAFVAGALVVVVVAAGFVAGAAFVAVAVFVVAGLVAVALAAVFAAGLAAVFVADERVDVETDAAAFLVVLVAAATPEALASMATGMPCSPSARRTTRPRAAFTSAARMASATSAPVTEPAVRPLRTRDCRALWENSGGSALVSGVFVDTGDTDYLSSRMAAGRGHAERAPGAAGKVLCDTASVGRIVLGWGW